MSCFSLAFHTFILAGCTRKLPLRPSAKISSLTGTYYFKKLITQTILLKEIIEL